MTFGVPGLPPIRRRYIQFQLCVFPCFDAGLYFNSSWQVWNRGFRLGMVLFDLTVAVELNEPIVLPVVDGSSLYGTGHNPPAAPPANTEGNLKA